jgi:predicted amidohydrolase
MHAEPTRVTDNIDKAAALVETAAQRGARLVALPELFNVGYFVGAELFHLAESEDGRTVTWMREQARRHGILLAGTIAERKEGHLYNTMFIAEPDGVLHRHAKRTPTITEQAAFDAADDDPVARTSLGRAGQLICAEAVFSRCVRPLVGAVDIVVFSQASFAPRPVGRLMDWWERRSGRSIVPALRVTGAPAVCAGMVGTVQRMTRLLPSYLYGTSCVTDAQGRILDRVAFDREGVAAAPVVISNIGGSSKTLPDPWGWRTLADRLLVRPRNLRAPQGGDGGDAP